MLSVQSWIVNSTGIVQTGITECNSVSHLLKGKWGCSWFWELTIDGNGDRLSQDEVIGAHEGRDSSERVELEVFGVDIWRSGFDEFDIEFVLFR